MVNSICILYLNKEIPLSKIHEIKADLKRYVEFYEKITFIEDTYDGDILNHMISINSYFFSFNSCSDINSMFSFYRD